MTRARHNIVAELHCHTEFSMDGLITFDGLRKTAAERGINVVCITDHDTIEGAVAFQKRARQLGSELQIIVGEERTLDDKSHLIGLFLKEPVSSTSRDAAIDEIHAQGGLVLLPHPFRKKDGLLRDVEQPSAETVRGIDAFELFNAKGSFADNERSRSLLNLPLGVFGGSDAHYESDIGQCVCELPLRGGVEESVRAMLKRELPFVIRGIHKQPGTDERRYAPAYYRIRKFVRIPRPLVPAAKQVYRFYRNKILEPSAPVLEEIYAHE
jgi:predicted metal-dependent phosphoesterase TrpH